MPKFKKSIAVFLIVTVVLGGISFFVLKDIEFDVLYVKYIFILLMFLLSALIGYIISKGTENKENQKCLDLIIHGCNPKAFLQKYSGIIKKVSKKSRKNSVYKATYSLGLIADGQYEKAVSYLSDSILSGKNKKELKINRVIYNYLCSAYGNLGDFESGKKYLEHLKNTNQDIKENKLIPNEFESVIEFYEHFLNDYSLEESILYFEDYFNTKAFTRYNKVMVKYKLSLLYKEEGNNEKYNECIDYVERNGKGLAVAVKAREMINNNLNI